MDEAYTAFRVSNHVYWVGAIDWTLREFHGYSTPRGTTYNAYLIIGKHIALVDTVKEAFRDEMMARITSVIPPDSIDYIISNHSEMDHTGCLLEVMDMIKPQKVLASAMGVKALQDHFGIDDRITAVKENEPLDLGDLQLTFTEARMLHWPDSMTTFLNKDGILFSQDTFGMHLASRERFADEIAEDILAQESAKYFANILMPFAARMSRFLEKLREIIGDIRMIAPDHGPIWRHDLSWILDRYAAWSARKTSYKAVVMYDTMWHSTERMAQALHDGLLAGGAESKLMPLGQSHRSDIATEMLDAGVLLVGTPALNGQMFPTVADVLTYLKGLQPRPLIAGAFGSYGWSGEAVDQVNVVLQEMKIPTLCEPIKVRYRPDSNALARCYSAGCDIARRLQQQLSADKTP